MGQGRVPIADVENILTDSQEADIFTAIKTNTP